MATSINFTSVFWLCYFTLSSKSFLQHPRKVKLSIQVLVLSTELVIRSHVCKALLWLMLLLSANGYHLAPLGHPLTTLHFGNFLFTSSSYSLRRNYLRPLGFGKIPSDFTPTIEILCIASLIKLICIHRYIQVIT